jgi:hypothetical protein
MTQFETQEDSRMIALPCQKRKEYLLVNSSVMGDFLYSHLIIEYYSFAKTQINLRIQ